MTFFSKSKEFALRQVNAEHLRAHSAALVGSVNLSVTAFGQTETKKKIKGNQQNLFIKGEMILWETDMYQ